MSSLVFDDESPKFKYPDTKLPWHEGFGSTSPPTTLEYVVNHVFFPVYHPVDDDHTEKNEHTLVSAMKAAACDYTECVDDDDQPYWSPISKMLENLRAIIELKLDLDGVITQLSELSAGDILVFPTPQHTTCCGVIFRREEFCTTYESLSVASPDIAAFEEDEYAYPELAIQVSNGLFDSEDFQFKLAGFLSGTGENLPTDLLLGIGYNVEPERITKHAVHIGSSSRRWSRSRTWLLIRVAIQLSLDCSPLGRHGYKVFILFFMCSLANHPVTINLSTFLLHSMSTKILRRFRKLGPTVPQWLSDDVWRACSSLSMTVDGRSQKIQTSATSLSAWDPFKLIVDEDIHPSLPHFREYISTLNCGTHLSRAPFHPGSRVRGTLCDFLSGHDNLLCHPDDFSEDVRVALHDVEQAVGNDIDDWLAKVTDVEEACQQLEDLVHRYMSFAWDIYGYGKAVDLNSPGSDSDRLSGSTMLLTIIELWVALDKLVVKEIPILAEYSPEVPLVLLSNLLLRDASSIHRHCRAYQYLAARHAHSRPGWSALSDEFTEQSFPSRYYDNSVALQQLNARIQYELPSDSFHAKTAVFELECPVSFDMWRSVTCWISCVRLHEKLDGVVRVRDIPAMQPYLRASYRRIVTLYPSHSVAQRWDRSYFVYEGCYLPRHLHIYQLSDGPYARSGLQQYLDSTSHTSNEVLAAQAQCDPKLSLNEFVAFGHLRSGGSLQWFNILRELRTRTLDFHHLEVYLLLTQASMQVGPLDDSGKLMWHQDLQDSSFCQNLLEELEILFVNLEMGSLDGLGMAVVSLLAAAIASRSCEDVLARAVDLLEKVRRKTFEWVQELVYNIRRSDSPTNGESLALLRDIAAVCRKTFDAGTAASHEPFRSAQDIEIALACTMLIRTSTLFAPDSESCAYSKVLLDRDRHLSLLLESKLREAIQADIADLGVDSAVHLVWPGYQPGSHRWELLQPPNSQWLVCETAQSKGKPSQTVHVNLFDGSLLVDGMLLTDKLPSIITRNPTFRELFGDHSPMFTASDIPGMDFVMMSIVNKYRIHIAARSHNDALGLRQHNTVVFCAENEYSDDIFHLIPREILEGDLPKSLVEGYVHWLNLQTSTLEIRPIQNPWMQSPENWSIHLHAKQFYGMKGSEILVDKQSPTWSMISGLLRCLDHPENLVITASTVDTPSLRLSVTLPRYGLSFFVNDVGQLESRDFEAMVYDEDQCIGTLFGLVNQLVLRPKSQPEVDVIPKCVIIAEVADPGYLPHSGRACYHMYQADSELGCLSGVFGKESRLRLAVLHATTSGACRPDPLTGRTGLEEAISVVWLAGIIGPHSYWFPPTESPQIRYALAKIQVRPQDELPNSNPLPTFDALLREACLFPSEISVFLPSRNLPFESLDQLLYERLAPNLRGRNRLSHRDFGCHCPSGLPSPNVQLLRQLLSTLRINESAPAFQSTYISHLHSSAHHFQTTPSSSFTFQHASAEHGVETLRKYYVQCRIDYLESLDIVKKALGPKTQLEELVDRCSQWPRITPFTLFRCLASSSPIKLPENWKKCLVELALLALDVQRARRLLLFALDGHEEELYKELENEGCDGWDPAEHPDWLMIQLQGNFLIRRVQVDIAKEMMSPRSGKNTVMQVNMGEGKTSVIIPICAATLADGDQLVRVIAPKALIPQTIRLLTDRLSGLVDKPIYHLTFTRGDMNPNIHGQYKIEDIRELMHRCKDEGGIIVMQPEHVLSLKLACIETQLLENGIRTYLTPGVPNQKRDFKRILQKLAGSFVKSLTGNPYVSVLIGGVNQSHDEPKIQGPEEIERANMDMRSRQANASLELQRFLESCTRDILDESDDVLRPQFQLIYAIGHQHPFEGSPGRWIVIQQILELLKRHAYLLSTHDSCAIRCDGDLPGLFPHIHILQTECGEQLMSLIAQDALDGRLSSLEFRPEVGLGEAVRRFILQRDIHPDIAEMVEKSARQSASWGSLLLLRGLFAHNVLLFALTQRRWRVDYGLDLSSEPRTMLAIPYRAKDVPAETAEFGHPDITILLTCLSYYYGGLSEAQLRTSFELLLQQDDASSEYALWLEDFGASSLPIALRRLSNVNIRSFEQWATYLVPLFARNKRAIDLYLSKIVFPNHAKEFPQKIFGSYWDIAERKNRLVTGFSGTNDGQYLLPTSIIQDDPNHLHQSGTNASVLTSLLHPENSSYMVMTSETGEQWSTLELLRVVVALDPKIRVLLDVGAQILDLPNLALAKAWLVLTPVTDVVGAVYFNERDELMVLTRNGTESPLSSSPLAQQLHRCVAYLDDAHTRGTDLKFPLGFRAAVTLGHKVTKDRLVQGCMRMRKLGHGHSVTFFAPRHIDLRIRGLVGKEHHSATITTADILHWAIHETCSGIQRQCLYWAQQGISHRTRYEAWSRFGKNQATPEELAKAWVQPELKSLDDMYMSSSSESPDAAASTNLPRDIRERCENLGVLSLLDVRMDEEQEREVLREIEREREVERPPKASPATHVLHPDVVQLVRTGVVPSPSWSEAIRHVFATNINNAFAASEDPQAWSPYLLATADFCETIVHSESVQGMVNDYLRPVQWILSAKMRGKDALVLLSPFEADQLMPEIRASERVRLHLYIPRTTKRMKPSDDLTLYTVPPLPSDWTPPWTLIDQLNVFAGQLYLSNYASCVRMCRFLGVWTVDLPPEGDTGVTRSWFDLDLSDAKIKDRFNGTPAPLVMQLLAMRRGMSFAGTHMGRILEGWPLSEADFESSGTRSVNYVERDVSALVSL